MIFSVRSILSIFVLLLVACAPPQESDSSAVARNNFTHVDDDDPKMNAAIAQAKQTVNQFVVAFHQHKPGTSRFFVKKPFPTSPGKVEHIWVKVKTEKNGTIEGTIENIPQETTEIKLGQKVTLKANEISDWQYILGKKLVGGFSIRYLVEKLPAGERSAFLQEAGFEL